MSFFVHATSPPHYKTGGSITSLILAAIFIVMVVAQLFTFENFPDIIMRMSLPWSGEAAAMLQAMLIVILEVAALPYLLSMTLNPVSRLVSMIAGWLAIAWWLHTSLWINIARAHAPNGGILGATVDVSSGWWMVGFSVVLAALAVWTARAMWPFVRTPKK